MAITKETVRMINRVVATGISEDDAWTLRRISMTLRGHELDRGCIEREGDGRPWFRHSNGHAYQIPDREKDALKRLAAVMARYPDLSYYVQGDPRGASLYILRPGDVPQGGQANMYYSRGLAIHG